MNAIKRGRNGAVWRRLVAVLLALGVGGSLLSVEAVGQAEAKPGAASMKDPATQPRYGQFYRQRVKWKSCGDKKLSLQCASVRVPVDWERPDDGSISLAVTRHRATGKRKGSLLLNPGGPGVSGTGFVPGVALGIGGDLVAAYDLVGWDPRGAGESHPLTCPAKADRKFAKVDSSPDDLRERLAYEKAAAEWARACQRSSGRLFKHVDALSTVRDMDVLRAVLGEKKLTYAGFSYGSVLGVWYADMFPERVGRMVLDSVAEPTLDFARWMRDNAAAKEDALRGYLKTCKKRSGCPFRSIGTAKAYSWLLGVLRKADKRPLRVSGGKIVTQSMLYNAVYNLLIQPRAWPELDKVLGALRRGNAKPALTAAGEKSSDPPITIANAAPTCLDMPDRRSARAVMADAARSERRSPVFARTTIAGTNAICAKWPVPSVVRPHKVTARKAAPILVVAITHDTAGPYKWGKSLGRQLASARLLTFDGYGHGAIISSRCAVKAETRYLVDGVLPPKGKVCRS